MLQTHLQTRNLNRSLSRNLDLSQGPSLSHNPPARPMTAFRDRGLGGEVSPGVGVSGRVVIGKAVRGIMADRGDVVSRVGMVMAGTGTAHSLALDGTVNGAVFREDEMMVRHGS